MSDDWSLHYLYMYYVGTLILKFVDNIFLISN